MSCNCSSQPIVAAIDQRFESEANGDEAIHWLGSATFPSLGGARSVSHYVAILGVDGPSTAVELVAQGSIDGKSCGNIEGLNSPTPYTAPTTTPLQTRRRIAAFHPILHNRSQMHFLLGGEQRNPTNVAQIVTKSITHGRGT